jgi:hypothetical protein
MRTRVVVASLALLAACEMPDGTVAPPSPLAPVELGDQLALIDRGSRTVSLLDAGGDLRPRQIQVEHDPVAATRRPGTQDLLVLSRGERGGPRVKPTSPVLTVIPRDEKTTVARLPLASRFDRLTASDDGRFVIAMFGTDVKNGDLLFNPNELAIIDLAAAAPVVTPRTLRSFGTVPKGVVFSPPLPSEDGPLRLAVVLSDNNLTLVDLERADRAEITIPLTLPDDRRLVQPQQVIFDDRDPTIYVRAAQANDIYAIRLVPVPASERMGHPFRPSLSQLAAGTAPSDMALFDAPDGRRLLVTSAGSPEAFVIDVRTSRSTRLPLDAPAGRIQLFSAGAPGNPQVKPRALLMGAGNNTLSFLDLDGLEELRTRNVEGRTMTGPAIKVVPFLDRGIVLLGHGDGGAGVSVVDLTRRTVAPINAAERLENIVVGQPADRLWIAPQASQRLAFLRLDGLASGEVRLDASVASVHALAPRPDGRSFVAVVHPDPGGDVTVLDAANPDRATARRVHGLFLQNLLERGDR